jgi:predicted RNA binding protein YcfA (HicA-like mRNA interferase family)
VSKRRKRLEKLRQNPKDVSFDDLRKVLEDFGFELVRSCGSHFAFRHDELEELFICRTENHM